MAPVIPIDINTQACTHVHTEMNVLLLNQYDKTRTVVDRSLHANLSYVFNHVTVDDTPIT